MKKSLFALLAALSLNAAATAQNTPASPSAPPTMGRENTNTGANRSNTSTTDPARGNSTGTMNSGSMNNSTGTMRNDGSTTAMERGDAGSMIGNMSRAEFDRLNAEGNAKVAAIKPTSTPLSKADQKLLAQLAMGGLMQLQMSQAALDRVQRDDVKVLAQSEVEEQTGVSAKIQEIVSAKGMQPMSTELSAATTQIQERMAATSGTELDRYYIRNSGVKGHEGLMATGQKILSKAQDPALKALAAATAPVIKMHMQVSQQVLDKMGKEGGASMGGGNNNGR